MDTFGDTSLSETRRQLMRRLVQPDPLFFEASEAAKYYRPFLEAAKDAGLTAVISHERLSGHPSSGGHDRCLIAERLRATFPDARILIVIREQCELIRSMYNQLVKAGSAESLQQHLIRSKKRPLKRPTFSLEYYEFDRLIEFYFKLFDRTKVLVLPMELLTREPQQFADTISTFCGHPTVPVGPIKKSNPRRPQLMSALWRPLNMFFYDNELSPGAVVNIQDFSGKFSRLRFLFGYISPRALERRINERQLKQIKDFVGSHYANSNRRTQEITGLPLAELGYTV